MKIPTWAIVAAAAALWYFYIRPRQSVGGAPPGSTIYKLPPREEPPAQNQPDQGLALAGKVAGDVAGIFGKLIDKWDSSQDAAATVDTNLGGTAQAELDAATPLWSGDFQLTTSW